MKRSALALLVLAALASSVISLPRPGAEASPVFLGDTDLVVDLIKNENITVVEDVEHTETITVRIENGVGPTRVAVELTQLSTDTTKCVSHLVDEPGDTLTEWTDGDGFHSKLIWTEPLMAASEIRDVTRDYTIVCSEAGSFPNIEQFEVYVDPLDMEELDPESNIDDNYVSVQSSSAPVGAVGGIVEPRVAGADSAASVTESAGSSAPPYAAIAGAAAAAALAVTAGAWYARRRWLR